MNQATQLGEADTRVTCATGPDGLTPYLQDGWRVFQGSGWYLGVAEQEGDFQARGEPRDSVRLLQRLVWNLSEVLAGCAGLESVQ